MLKSDQQELRDEIARVRNGLKPKVNKLRDAQNHPDLKGFDLTPLSRQEVQQIVPNKLQR